MKHLFKILCVVLIILPYITYANNNADMNGFIDDLSPSKEMHEIEMKRNDEAVEKLFDQISLMKDPDNDNNNDNNNMNDNINKIDNNGDNIPTLLQVNEELKNENNAADDEANALKERDQLYSQDDTSSMAEIKEKVETNTKWNALWSAAKKLGKGLRGKKSKDTKLRRVHDPKAQAYEDCMGCRYIWHQVEMDVANARYIEDVQASFEHNCLDAQKTEIFYKVCEDMYDDMYAMADDYMSNSWSVEEMCQRAGLCYNGRKKKMKK